MRTTTLLGVVSCLLVAGNVDHSLSAGPPGRPTYRVPARTPRPAPGRPPASGARSRLRRGPIRIEEAHRQAAAAALAGRGPSAGRAAAGRGPAPRSGGPPPPG